MRATHPVPRTLRSTIRVGVPVLAADERGVRDAVSGRGLALCPGEACRGERRRAGQDVLPGPTERRFGTIQACARKAVGASLEA